MDFDELGQAQLDLTENIWREKFASCGPDIVNLASKYRGNQPCIPVNIAGGSFNFCVQVRFDDGTEWMLRFPIPGRVMYPEEKTRQEVATMRFIKANTNIPIPNLIAFGMARDNPMGLGPFIITEFVEGKLLSEFLQLNPPDPDGKTLRPDIEDRTLDIIYKQIASIILELSDHDFDKIGSLALDEGESSWSVGSRPLTLKINEIERCGGVVIDGHLDPFETVADYMLDLAQQNIVQLKEQRNCVDNAEDARQKYVCRHLFRAITPHFVSKEYNRGPFKLFCDDFRPGNILVDENLRITAVLDWEWCYAAPYQFLYSPPRWLLLKPPTLWENGDLDAPDLLNAYLSKFERFVRALEEEEEEKRMKQRGCNLSHVQQKSPERISSLMRKSMINGAFWFNEAARESFSLDQIWWSRLDEFCFGPRENGVKGRVDCIGRAAIHRNLDAFVIAKMKQRRQYNLESGEAIGELKCVSEENFDARENEIEDRAIKAARTAPVRHIYDLLITVSNCQWLSFPLNSWRTTSISITAIPFICYCSIIWLRR